VPLPTSPAEGLGGQIIKTCHFLVYYDVDKQKTDSSELVVHTGLNLFLCPEERVVHTRRRVVLGRWTNVNTVIFGVLFDNFITSVRA